MGKIIALIILAAALAGCVAMESPSSSAADENTPLTGSQTVVLLVHGLSCPLCASNVERPLRKLEGVQDLTVDLKSGEVTVLLGDGHAVTRAQLRKAVTDSGFTLKDIKPLEGAE